jgi:hypothetical protein
VQHKHVSRDGGRTHAHALATNQDSVLHGTMKLHTVNHLVPNAHFLTSTAGV